MFEESVRAECHPGIQGHKAKPWGCGCDTRGPSTMQSLQSPNCIITLHLQVLQQPPLVDLTALQGQAGAAPTFP